MKATFILLSLLTLLFSCNKNDTASVDYENYTVKIGTHPMGAGNTYHSSVYLKDKDGQLVKAVNKFFQFNLNMQVKYTNGDLHYVSKTIKGKINANGDFEVTLNLEKPFLSEIESVSSVNFSMITLSPNPNDKVYEYSKTFSSNTLYDSFFGLYDYLTGNMKLRIVELSESYLQGFNDATDTIDFHKSKVVAVAIDNGLILEEI